MDSKVPLQPFNVPYSLKYFHLDIPSPLSHPFFPWNHLFWSFSFVLHVVKKKWHQIKEKASLDSPWLYIKTASFFHPPVSHTQLSAPFDTDDD